MSSNDSTASQSLLDPSPVEVQNKNSADVAARTMLLYGVYVTFFTSLWFVSDPGYTLFAKFGFKSVMKQMPSQVVSAVVVLFWWQMFACSVGSLALSLHMVKERRLEFREALIPGKATIIMIVLNGVAQSMQMAALGFGSLSFSQVIRSMEPVFLLFWFKISNTPCDVILYVSTIPIYLGAILAAGTESHFSWIAICTGTLSNLMLTGRNFFLKLALSEEKELPVSLLLFQTSLLPCLLSSVMILLLGSAGFPVLGLLFQRNFVFSGCLFAVMRYSSLLMLKEFSLLAHSLLKLSRRVVVIVIAYILFHSSIDSVHVCGICMTLFGAACAELVKR